jgi:hypothetical protein
MHPVFFYFVSLYYPLYVAILVELSQKKVDVLNVPPLLRARLRIAATHPVRLLGMFAFKSFISRILITLIFPTCITKNTLMLKIYI